MKKSLLCFASLAIGSALSAQITINQGDIAPLYTGVLQNNDTLTSSSLLPGNAGANQTYNLTMMNAHTTDTLVFTQPQFTPNGSNFPGSNEAATVNTNQAYIYFNLSSTSFEVTGQSADPIGSGLIDIPFTDYEKMMNLPCTYNTGFMDTARGEGWTYLGYDPGVGFVIDSVHIRSTVYKNSWVDGWGSATTPLGTYNVLRINTARRQLDTIDIQTMSVWIYEAFTQDDSVRTYTYWANGLGFPLAELTDYQDFGTITGATWLQATPTPNVGVPEFNSGAIANVYPNPSIETVTFVSNGAKVAVINLTDVNGRIIRSVNVTADQTTMNVSDLASGMYFYQAVDAHGAILEKGKLNVYH
jgi:hypothetical protein